MDVFLTWVLLKHCVYCNYFDNITIRTRISGFKGKRNRLLICFFTNNVMRTLQRNPVSLLKIQFHWTIGITVILIEPVSGSIANLRCMCEAPVIEDPSDYIFTDPLQCNYLFVWDILVDLNPSHTNVYSTLGKRIEAKKQDVIYKPLS